jgi:hypothetical protein
LSSSRASKNAVEIRNNNNSNSGYSNDILNTGHACGNITNTMDIKKEKKGNTLTHWKNTTYIKSVKTNYI